MFPSVDMVAMIIFVPGLFLATLTMASSPPARGATAGEASRMSETFETYAIIAGMIGLFIATVVMGLIAARSNRD